MKSIAIQFIEAVREMKEAEVVLQRTVHLSFVPGKSTSIIIIISTEQNNLNYVASPFTFQIIFIFSRLHF